MYYIKQGFPSFSQHDHIQSFQLFRRIQVDMHVFMYVIFFLTMNREIYFIRFNINTTMLKKQ